MPLTTKERAYVEAHGLPCNCNWQMAIAYLNVLLDRDPTNRLDGDDPDVQELLGYRVPTDPVR